MLNRIRYFCVLIMLAGTVMMAINTMFGYNTVSWIYRYHTGQTWLWRINVSGYIRNIELAFQDTSRLELHMPETKWIDMADYDYSIIDGEWWQILGNNLAVMLNYMILIGNVLIYPIRIGAYAVRCILAIIGIAILTPEKSSGLTWLVDLTNWMQEHAQIPYITTDISNLVPRD